MPEIRVPTMVLAARDDPWIPVEHYRDFKWSDNPWLLPVMPKSGGHVGFHGDDSGQPWCDTGAGEIPRTSLIDEFARHATA